MSIQLIYETDHNSLLRDSTMSNALNFCFYLCYCNLKEKDHTRRIINNKKYIFISEISIIIILIYRKFGSVGSVQQTKSLRLIVI